MVAAEVAEEAEWSRTQVVGFLQPQVPTQAVVVLVEEDLAPDPL